MLLGNRYQVLQTLGAGGFGTTYLAEDTQMPSRRKCVIKQLKPINNNPQIYQLVQERFQREAAILEDLGNRNGQIPDLYAYFSEGDQFYLIQEWIEGSTLREKVETEGCQAEPLVRQILMDLLPVLGYVHSKHIVHRDIKPDNIILRKRDGKPVLIDFGAVRETMGTVMNSQGQTASSIVIGTPGFMPSEQAAGRPLYSSDLYSLGLTMIYLLTGRYPHEIESDPSTGDIIWRQFAPTVSPQFFNVLDKAIQYHPRDRFPTAQDMLVAIQDYDSRPLTAAGVDPTVVAPAWHPDAQSVPSTQVQAANLPPTVVNPPPTAQQAVSPAGQFVAGEYNAQAGGTAGSIHTNTSSDGSNGVGSILPWLNSQTIPNDVPGWNWGAFWLPGLWCINNQVWLGLLAWSGIVTGTLGWWVAAFLLGAKGNEWAWKSRRWRDLETFKRNQRNWAIGGFVTWSSVVALITVVAIFVPTEPETNISDSPNATTASPDTPTAPNPFSGVASPDANPQAGSTTSQPTFDPLSGVASSGVETNVYPDAEIQAYMTSCIDSAVNNGATQSQAQTYCSCTLEKLQQQYTYQEFTQLVQELQRSQQLTPEFKAIIDACQPS